MNRKKIALLLTGLIVTSSIFTGCDSSSNNKTSQDKSRVAQEESILKRASERTVTEYNQDSIDQYPNVAYADDITDNSIGNEMREDLNSFSTENQFDNVQNYENNTNRNDMNLNDGNLFDTTTQDYQMNPSDEIITNDQMHSFENSTIQTPINGFSNVVEDDYYENNLNQNEISNSDEGSSNFNIKQNVQNKDNSRNTMRGQVDESKLAGHISVVSVKGSSEITGNKPQGIAEVSFKLSGDVLKAVDSQQVALSTLLQNAYEETRQDANTGYVGNGTTTEREKLQAGLKTIFTPSNTEIKMIFRSNDGVVRTIPFNVDDMFPDKASVSNYVRNIVDLDATSGQVRAIRSANPTDIVIKMLVRVGSPNGSNELKTNTEYSFVGIEGDNNLKVTDVESTKNQLVGFTIPNFKTGKTPAKMDATDDSGSIIYEGTSSSAEGTQQNDFYLNNVTNNTYIDMKKLIDSTEKVELTGTSIKFKSVILNDVDETVSKIEIEDDRGMKYPVSLIPVDSSNENSGKYIEITGLRRDTPYIFTKLNMTYKVGDQQENKVIHFANFDGTKLEINNLPIRTTAFSGPQLSLGASHDQKVTLPGGLEVESVKNDSTALRYILKVNNPEGFIGDVRINGLRAGEKSKVEKIVDDSSKVNYYVVTLSNLTKNTDYGFLIIEVDYKDPEGNELVGRQALGDINNSGTGRTDNKTESSELTGTEAFNVIVNENITSKNARSTEVPIFIDDLHDKFLRIDFVAPKDNPDAKVVYENGKLKFTDLKPESNTVCKVDFIYSKSSSNVDTNTRSSKTVRSKSSDGTTNEDKISKYIKIVTPKVSDLDIKTATIVANSNDAEVTFELYSEAKSEVRNVIVKDSQEKEIKSSWNKETKVLKLEELTEETEYSNLKVIFTLENGKTVEYTLDTFTTNAEEVRPTGRVADFVSRVYKIALGRDPEIEGWEFWIGKLESKEITATEFIAENLMTQPEFVDRELSKRTFVTTMYSLIVNREPDEEGQKYWERKYDEYRRTTNSVEELRIKIAREMMNESEFKELVTELNLKY